jgi:hypothetical protein
VSGILRHAEIIPAAIRHSRERAAELILQCGDSESAATVRLFMDGLTGFRLGNWDNAVN